jgi:hypothetical protein
MNEWSLSLHAPICIYVVHSDTFIFVIKSHIVMVIVWRWKRTYNCSYELRRAKISVGHGPFWRKFRSFVSPTKCAVSEYQIEDQGFGSALSCWAFCETGRTEEWIESVGTLIDGRDLRRVAMPLHHHMPCPGIEPRHWLLASWSVARLLFWRNSENWNVL